ncbi:PD-(D/E)XK nuclease superfamily protein [Desulfonatronum zhilinae]|nr:PD-(D/E)XK nuclease superfamily protein [Desulfonatronum zhilinae]
MKKLPIGIQTFENMIRENFAYVDKTSFVAGLRDEGKYYFLSRPRRFGKSLLLSTIKAAFQGKKELFQGLYLEHNWDWETVHPVVHVSFGSGVTRSLDELQGAFSYILDEHAKAYAITSVYTDLRTRFADLIKTLHDTFGRQVVVLVDEYDKPILDNIENPDLAREVREELKNYYSVIKDSDPYIRFVFITGVSKFSKVSLFSGLNNLNDITLDKRYSALCGYTQEDLETVFADRLHGVDLEQIRLWYNGYNWLGREVYNPFDILLYLDSQELRPYWFETGTPTFLVKLLQQGKYHIPALEDLTTSEKLLGSFDVEAVEVETLLFQTGYLTIKSVQQLAGTRRFRLGYPNLEVKQSLTDALLPRLTGVLAASEAAKFDAYDALAAVNLDGLRSIFHAFFASIPADWYRKNQLAGYEGYYSSIFYCYFAALGLEVIPEDTSSHGRIDLTVKLDNRVFIFEFKVLGKNAAPGSALDQIKRKGYADKYAALGTTVYLIGVEFEPEERNIAGFAWEEVENAS